MNIRIALVALATSPLFAAPAFANDRCGNVPDADWISVADVAKIATDAGYTVREVERDDGCYELNVVDANGVRFELDIHPGTGEIVRTERD